MARDSEITAIRMSGVSLRRLFLPLFLVGLLASAASFAISERVVPWSVRAKSQIETAMFGYALAASPELAANRVFVYQNYEFYVGEADHDPKLGKDVLRLHDITIFQNPRLGVGYPTLITAASALYRNGQWSLNNVVVHTFDSTGFTSTEARAPMMNLDLRVALPTATDATGIGSSPDSFTMAELGRQIKVMTQSKLDARSLEVSYYFKLSLPFLCFAFALCAPPLSLRWARTGSFMGVFLSIVMIWVAWNTLLLAKFLGIYGYISPPLAAWSPDILFAVAGIVLLRKAE